MRPAETAGPSGLGSSGNYFESGREIADFGGQPAGLSPRHPPSALATLPWGRLGGAEPRERERHSARWSGLCVMRHAQLAPRSTLT